MAVYWREKKSIALVYIMLSILSIAMIIPFYWMLVTSVKKPSEVITYPPVWFPSKIQWNNFRRLFQQAEFGKFFRNSSIVTACAVPMVLFTSSLAGFIFAKYRFRGNNVLFLIVLSSMMVPFAVVMIPLYIEMTLFNWIDTFYALIAPWTVNAFGIFLMRQFMFEVPESLMDAARIDGCSEFQIYWRIILPNIKAALSALSIFIFLWSWDSFLWPLVVTSSSNTKTLPVGVAMFSNQWWTQYNLVMAGAVVIVLPVLIVFLMLQRHFIQGIVLSGLKV